MVIQNRLQELENCKVEMKPGKEYEEDESKLQITSIGVGWWVDVAVKGRECDVKVSSPSMVAR